MKDDTRDETPDTAGARDDATETGPSAEVSETAETQDHLVADARAEVSEADDTDRGSASSDSGEESSDADQGDSDENDSADENDSEAPAGDGTTPGSGSSRRQQLDNEGEIAADYLEDLLDIVDLDGDIDTFVEGGRAHVSIITDSAELVGKEGKVLEALQELARLAVMTETGHRSRLMLDVGGHREKRRRELQDLAADAVAEAKDSGDAVRLAPMNPFERKIVHDAVAAAGLTSESEGEEPTRRVVVMPA